MAARWGCFGRWRRGDGDGGWRGFAFLRFGDTVVRPGKQGGGDILDALGGVRGIRIGVAFFGGGLAADEFTERALGFAYRCLRAGFTRSDLRPRAIPLLANALGAALVGEFVALGGEVDLAPAVAVASLLIGDDEAGGECRFDGVVRTEGRDLGDDGVLAEGRGFLGGVGGGGRWRLRARTR